MELHSLVFLGIGVVAFGYWLCAEEFFPKRQEQYVDRKDIGYKSL